LADESRALMALFEELNISACAVPADFPSLQLEKLRSLGLDIEVSVAPLFPQREIKSPEEAAQIALANKAACACFDCAEDILAESSISRGAIIWRGKTLTSEIVKFEMEKIALGLCADLRREIFACGAQACDPHSEGSGALKPHSLIVADIFPKLKKSGYFGDMTRTYLKGRPSAAQARLVETVAAAQKLAMSKISAGVDGAFVHAAVKDFFASKGYLTECKDGKWSGFFHSTGHGLGLDIHEHPRLGVSSNTLKSGMAVTVEPGLYYEDLGGCRIEDCVLVQDDGYKMLSKHPYNWIID